jgi:uncharacterized cupin superfamily protein
MPIVFEVLDSFPKSDLVRVIERNEELLLQIPKPKIAKMWEESPAPLPVYHFSAQYKPMPFAPPRGVFEGPSLRFEWQNINGRQPFYHRNSDADELSFQVSGERTLMTELGTVELRPGHFTNIPVGVAHDNFGREEVHILFYLHGPAVPTRAPVRSGEYLKSPFKGWEARTQAEMTTHCLGGPHCDVAVSLVNEDLLLKAGAASQEKIEAFEAPGATGEIEWMFKAPRVWIGHTSITNETPRRFIRHLAADEMQYQVSGKRTLVTQRGTVTLDPGDCLSIPFGCAFASFAEGGSKHVSVLAADPAPAVVAPVRYADIKPTA